jgi:hypothetical protein
MIRVSRNCCKEGLTKAMKIFIRLFCLIVCCLPAGGFAQNAPQSIAATVVSLGTIAAVPIYAINFNDINSCNLKLGYDPAVATATGVTIGPGLGGMISTNLTVPGEIVLGWYTLGGVSLPDSSIIFTISFLKNNFGHSPISWIDNGNSCKYSNSSFITLIDTPTSEYYHDGSITFQSPNAPVTSLIDITAFPGSIVSLPVTVTDFQMIGSFSLNLQFDPSVMTFHSYSNDAEFPGMSIDGSQPGVIVIEGLVPPGDTAVTLEDNATLLTLNFNYLDGFTMLNWIDSGTSCQYAGSLPIYPVLNDTPQSAYYINGSVTASYLPAAAGAINGPSLVCAGSSGVIYSVPEIAYATGYHWEVPDEATIISGQNTNSILIDFDASIFTGNISVYGTNSYGNGQPAHLEVSAIEQPGAAGLITGPDQVCQGQTGVIYSVQPIENATAYNWILPVGANIISGSNTNSIALSFSNTAMTGTLSVFGSNMCGPGAISAPLQVNVSEIPLIIIQPESPPAIYQGSGNAMISVKASGSGLTYQWQEYITSWSDLNENEMYSGVHTDSLLIVNPVVSMNGYRYRCVIDGQCEPQTITDGVATLTVLLPVGISVNTNKISLLAYPNPCSTELHLNFFLPCAGNLLITLQSVIGETILYMKESILNPGNQSVILNTASVKPGLYMLVLKLEDDNNLMIATEKIVCDH